MKTMRQCLRAWFLASLVLAQGVFFLCETTSARADDKRAGIEAAVFEADVTPPLGTASQAPPETIQKIEHPLLAKVIVLRSDKMTGGKTTVVLAAIDWCGVCNSAYAALQRTLAEGAQTTQDHVFVHTLHQHTAPIIDLDAQRWLDAANTGVLLCDAKYLETTVTQLRDAAAKALTNLAPVTHVGTSWAPVDRLASTRRIRLPDGSILVRGSSSKDPQAIAAPEGKVDGFVRTVSLWNEARPIAYLHYYATHPQSYYGDGRATYDVPGLARERLQSETGVPQIYFTGCGGDVGMGKYNDANPKRRAELADRLYAALRQSVAEPRKQAAKPLKWAWTEVPLAARNEDEWSDEFHRRRLADKRLPQMERAKSAMLLAFNERLLAGKQPLVVSGLSIGPVTLLHLPGEAFVEYQLWSQRQFEADKSRFVAVAAYGDCAMWYIPDDAAFADRGGYETTWAFAAPCEEMLKRKLLEVVGQLQAAERGAIP